MAKRISDTMEKALNRQINREMFSAYLYLAMSAHFESTNLKGFANWMKVQAREEMVHAMKIYGYVLQRGGTVVLDTIDAPASSWKSPVDVFEAVARHEQNVTGMIDELVDLSAGEKDHTTGAFLQWFVTEQVEEEASADEVLQKARLAGDAPGGLFILDAELGKRTFAAPAGADAPAGQ